MHDTPFVWTKRYVFKPVLVGHLLRLFAVIILGAWFLLVYAQSRSIVWLCVVGGWVVFGTALNWRYNAQMVVIENAEITIYRWLRKPIVVSIALDDIEMRQGPIGRIFDFGTLHIQLDGKDVKLASIGLMSAFSSIVGERQDVINQLLVAHRQRLQAEEHEIGQLLGHIRARRASEALAR